MKLIKISFISLNLIFFSGCVQSTALLGPGVTIATSGNIFQAGLQYGANKAIKNETGKDALIYVKDAVENNNKQKKFEIKFKKLVENRIQNTRRKLSLD